MAEILVVRDGALTSANEELIRHGSAEFYEQFASEDPDLARRLEAAEQEARAAGAGLWTACAAPQSTLAAAPELGGNCHPAHTPCVPPAPPDLDCADIGFRVQVDHAHVDPHRLDGSDDDGWGCESFG